MSQGKKGTKKESKVAQSRRLPSKSSLSQSDVQFVRGSRVLPSEAAIVSLLSDSDQGDYLISPEHLYALSGYVTTVTESIPILYILLKEDSTQSELLIVVRKPMYVSVKPRKDDNITCYGYLGRGPEGIVALLTDLIVDKFENRLCVRSNEPERYFAKLQCMFI